MHTSNRFGRNALIVLVLGACGLGAVGCRSTSYVQAHPRAPAHEPLTRIYPSAPRGDVVDEYHGEKVADPYRWMEELDTPQTRAWIDAENAETQSYLTLIPAREQLAKRLGELWNYERTTAPSKRGTRYFFGKNDGLQNQNVVFVAEALDATPRVLIDPNTLSKDGTVAVGGSSISSDGRWYAYGIADAGSDWTTWRVRDVDTGRDLPETIRWTKFNAPAWRKDGSGFYYARYAEPKAGEELKQKNEGQRVFFHRLLTEQRDDVLVYERPDQPEWGFGCTVSDDGAYVIVNASQGTDPKNRVFYARIEADAPAKITPLLVDFDASYDFIGNDGSRFFFVTNHGAPRQRVIAIDVEHPEPTAWRELVPQADDTLQSVSTIGRRFVANYLHDAHSRVAVFALDGKLEREVELPGLGTAGGFAGSIDDGETFYSFASFTTPATIYRYDVAAGKSELFHRPPTNFDASQYVTEQVFYPSKDGTRVPMFLTYKRGLKRDGRNPTLLYGYGGFNAAMTPSFQPARIAWLELGGVYALANLRGGSEYGEAWHLAGTKLQKQNVFDDFIAAGEWLIREKWTSSDKLAIQGGSNGGLLVGACITQRPELFGAALPAVGVMDMLRFREFTIGWAWESDYGSVKNADEFRALRAYSPVHNAKPGTCYPPTLITTADHDDRVFPAHSFKFAAALQAAQACANPILIRIDVRSGHGAGKPTSKQIEQAADELAFLVRELGM
ncbi:MAG: prolyl oligopeptidase family serine peptidase [Planctomycetes bacterium]|nr:prolyl oligopeptidase family serine peptidase [Planctomycetota bacterium]